MTPPTDIVEALEKAAKEATPGPWIQGYPSYGSWFNVYPDDESGAVADCYSEFVFRPDEQRRANAAFIAAANPSTVLALIAELKLAREVVKAARGRHEEWTRETYIAIDEALKSYDRIASMGRE